VVAALKNFAIAAPFGYRPRAMAANIRKSAQLFVRSARHYDALAGYHCGHVIARRAELIASRHQLPGAIKDACFLLFQNPRVRVPPRRKRRGSREMIVENIVHAFHLGLQTVREYYCREQFYLLNADLSKPGRRLLARDFRSHSGIFFSQKAHLNSLRGEEGQKPQNNTVDKCIVWSIIALSFR
jgi:hypothetical protein